MATEVEAYGRMRREARIDHPCDARNGRGESSGCDKVIEIAPLARGLLARVYVSADQFQPARLDEEAWRHVPVASHDPGAPEKAEDAREVLEDRKVRF